MKARGVVALALAATTVPVGVTPASATPRVDGSRHGVVDIAGYPGMIAWHLQIRSASRIRVTIPDRRTALCGMETTRTYVLTPTGGVIDWESWMLSHCAPGGLWKWTFTDLHDRRSVKLLVKVVR